MEYAVCNISARCIISNVKSNFSTRDEKGNIYMESFRLGILRRPERKIEGERKEDSAKSSSSFLHRRKKKTKDTGMKNTRLSEAQPAGTWRQADISNSNL